MSAGDLSVRWALVFFTPEWRRTMGLRVGLIGVGVVGGGVARLLTEEGERLGRLRRGLDIRLAVACDVREEALAPLSAEGIETATDPEAVVARDDVDVIVELVGGTTVAKDLVLKALRSGKHVVTANKALLAHAGPEIVRAAIDAGVGLGFEASVAGGVPVIGALRTGLAANDITSVTGIVNGTCNYVLTRMSHEGAAYAEALQDAKRHGYAEADPTFDVEGLDSAHKLAILAALSFATPVDLDAIYCEGISSLDVTDIRYAEQMGYVVKLLAIGKRPEGARSIELRVHPTLVPRLHPLAAVSGVFNAVEIVGHATGRVVFYGRGAGRAPTASAILADLIEIARGNSPVTTKELAFWSGGERLPVAPAGETTSRFYVRFSGRDEYGVLGRIARILGEHRASIASVIQTEPRKDASPGEGVPIVMLTHRAREADFRAALAEIDALECIASGSVSIHIEE